jgi:cytochrome P450
VATEPETAQLEDLFDVFAERRRSSPVWPESVAPGTGPGVTLYRFEDCARALRDPQAFSSSGYEQSIDLVMGRTILSMDDPDHKRHRDLVAHAFRQKALATWGDEVMGAVCEELVSRFRPGGRADLVADFSGEFPIRVTARILGLPPEDHARFQRWSMELIGIAGDLATGFAASGALRDYFAAIVHDRRTDLRQDVISDLVAAEIDGERLSDEAIYSFLRLLLPAGVETTARAIPSLLHRLLTHPEQLQAVTRDRALVPQAIEESLRLDVPVVYVVRVATRDVTIGGVPVPAGSFISLCLASANRDEARWVEPDRFDIDRPFQQHLTFAAGAHMCLGQHLARMEATVALNTLLDRLPGLRLDPDAKPPAVVALNQGSMPALDSLPVLFDAG